MFLDVDDARLNLAEILDPPRLEEFLPLLGPVVTLTETVRSDAAPGGSQIGGWPRVDPGFDWPAIDPATLRPGTLSAGSPAANAGNRAHLEAAVPMSFVAQLDLAEAARIPALAPLPDQGSLLFFYDFMIGPYEDSSVVGRVVWDRNEIGSLPEIAPPEALIAAADEMRAELRASHAKYGLEESWDEFSTIFEAPSRSVGLMEGVELPSPFALRPREAPSSLMRVLLGLGADDADHEVFEAYQEAHYLSNEASEAAPLRLLSPPLPEQDDPRLTAAALTILGDRINSPDAWEEKRIGIIMRAGEWQVLAQLDIAAWLQDSSEGQVYFLIRTEDLAAERFDKVVCIYQQT